MKKQVVSPQNVFPLDSVAMFKNKKWFYFYTSNTQHIKTVQLLRRKLDDIII